MATSDITQTAPAQVRHDWYQTDSTVVITALIKNVKNEFLTVNFYAKSIKLSVKNPDADIIECSFNLSHEIIPEECSYKITPSKIELKLIKTDAHRWNKLEGDEEDILKVALSEVLEGATVLSYPTSKKGKDWSAVEKEIKEAEAKEKPEAEEALNQLFQDIYGKGSDEVKKAMNKSYRESGGTVLSTNWGEISKEKVEVKPPDGMEWKKW